MAYKNIERDGVAYTVPELQTAVEDIYQNKKLLVVSYRFDQGPDLGYSDTPTKKGQLPAQLVVREIVDDLLLCGATTPGMIPADAVAVRPPYTKALEPATSKAHKGVRYYAVPFFKWRGPVYSELTQDNMLVQAVLELRQSNRELRDELDRLTSAFEKLKDDYDDHRRQDAEGAHDYRGF